MKKKCLLTVFLAGCAMSVSFAQITLQGKVTDEKGEPIPGANVRLEQTTIGCATNANGEFLLKNVKDGHYVLRASCLDYSPSTLPVSKSQNNMVIKLQETSVNLDQVVITGTGTHHRLKDSPVPIDVISQRDLQNANPADFQDALVKLVPSINFHTTSMGTTLYMNGLPDKYLLVLVNGKKVAGDISGSIDYNRINIASIKRIEVLKGASSALYGSDAIAGVINIITDDNKSLVNVSSNTRVSSHDRITEAVNADVNVGKFSSHTTYSYQQSGGWKLSPYEEDKKGNLVETTKQSVFKNHSHSISQTFGFDFSRRLSAEVNGQLYDNANDRPTDGYNYNNIHKSYTYGGTLRYLLGQKASYLEASTNTTNYRSYYDYTTDYSGNKLGDRVNSKEQTYTNSNLKGVFKTHQNNTLITGLDYVYEGLQPTVTSALLNDKAQSVNTFALYAQDEWRMIKSLSLVAGFRYSYNEKFKSNFTPKLSLMYQYEGLNVRGSYASAFRSPTLQQMYAISNSRNKITVGDPNLDPETSNFYNLNVEYNHHIFSASVSAYWNEIKDKIDTEKVDLTEDDIANGIVERNRYMNVEEARIKGFDVGLSVRPGAGLTFGANYVFSDGKNKTENIRLERSVRHSANVNGNWRKAWNKYSLSVNVNGRYQGTRYSESYGNAPAHQLWDLNTRHSFNLKSILLEPSIGIENLFNYVDDRPYNSNYATLTPGRALYVSLLIRFKQ